MKGTQGQTGRILLQIVAGLLVVAFITAVCFGAERIVIPSFLYLLVVVIESMWGGFRSAAIVSLAAATCLEYFFIPPVLEWQIDDPEDYLVLATYLATSLVITRLASRAGAEARTAERRRQDAALLYEAASQLLSLGPEMAAGPESLRVFCKVFELKAACFFDAASCQLQIEGESRYNLASKTRDACLAGKDYQNRDENLDIRCLRAGNKITGAAGFEGRIDDESVGLGVFVLAATALERMRAFRSASKAAAAAQAEMLRSAILDAFAHEFKTPLAIILTAAGGLRETSAESLDQKEMTEIIESQTVRLSQLTTRLLRIARLDRDEVKPMMERISLGALLHRVASPCESQFGHRISFVREDESVVVMADSELMGLAITQLLDNACKYSLPESVVSVSLSADAVHAEISVANEGIGIRPEERERIFERFFRGTETEQVAPGAGLGLYVARKIVRAHGGLLELDRNLTTPSLTVFRIRLPIVEQEQGQAHEQEANQSVSSGR